jgi:hypothetical protein
MPAQRPERETIQKAVDLYLPVAYPDGLPASVRSLLAILQTFAGDIYRSPAVSDDGARPPKRYSLRLGNKFYPHMKIAIELSPDASEFLFRADTHDQHVAPPPEHPEYKAYCEMVVKNQRLASAIEAEWGKAGLDTFKTFLKDDLARRAREGK